MSAAPETSEAARPVLVAVDDEPSVARAVERDLRRRYGRDFRVLRAECGADALDAVRQSKLRGAPVALLLADQRMPGMTGVEFLEQAIGVAPEAKRVLLTAYADTQAAIDAINRVSLDHYLLKPWDPPEEQLYPVLDDLLDDWRAEAPAAVRRDPGRRATAGRASRTSCATSWPATRCPYRWLDVERDAEGRRCWRPPDGDAARCRWCCCPTATRARSAHRPSELADQGRHPTAGPSCRFYDLVIVGGGPAGLARRGLRRLGGPAARRWSSGRRRAARPARARASRTTSASRSASPAATWPAGRPPRPSASAPRC